MQKISGLNRINKLRKQKKVNAMNEASNYKVYSPKSDHVFLQNLSFLENNAAFNQFLAAVTTHKRNRNIHPAVYAVNQVPAGDGSSFPLHLCYNRAFPTLPPFQLPL